MKTYSGLFGSAFITVCLVAAGVFAGPVQIGDFRLNGNAVSSNTYYDPSFSGFTTRNSGGPVNISSAFSGTSGLANGTTTTDDIGLRTYTALTRILRLNRHATVRDGGTADYAGAVQLSFDFGTTLSSYLIDNNLQLDAMYIRLNLDNTKETNWYDAYLSYTSAAEGIALTGISTGSETSDSDIYSTFVSPAGSASAGDVVDGKFKLLEKGKYADTDQTYSLLSAYHEGAREFNLILSSGSFWGSGDSLDILENSGIFIETSVIPEPATLGLLGVGAFGVILLRRRFK